MEDVAVVVAVPAVDAEVLHRLRASKNSREKSYSGMFWNVKRCALRTGTDLLDGEELDVDVAHGGVDDGAVRHPLGALGLSGGHHLLLGRLLVEDVSVRVGALRVLGFSLCELSR